MSGGDGKPKERKRQRLWWNGGDMTGESFMAHCRARMGIQITLPALCANLHASMPPTGCKEWGRMGDESATGRREELGEGGGL